MKTTGLNTYRDALVTDPEQQQVTDQAVINELARLGVAERKAVFKYDYSREFPVSKMYQIDDPNSPHHGKHIVAISQLPMVNSRGEKCLPRWIDNGDGTFSEGKNQFEASAGASGIVAIAPLNDQPSGVKAGVTTSWKPRLLLDGYEVMAVSGPVLLDVDPVNSNYSRNVLEWDYGICRRWLRLIEGRLLERWVFTQNPGATVRIEHGFQGPKLRLGPYAIDEDTEQVTREQFARAEYPFSISATGTFYPDANPESATVDGLVYRSASGTWAAITAGAGNGSSDSINAAEVKFIASSTTDQWQRLDRGITLFDTSSLTSAAAISAATFSLYSSNKSSESGTNPAVHCVSSNPASNTALANSDFETLGSISFGNIAFASWGNGYNDIALNASGIAAINKAGISKFGIKIANDVTGSAPTWASEATDVFTILYAEQGAGYKPKLVVVYTLPPTLTTDAATSIAQTSATINANLTNTGDATTTRYFQYGKTAAYELGSINKGTGAAGAYSHDLSGLDPSTLYYFRAYAINSAGTGYGSQQTFTTLASGQPLAGRLRGRIIHGGNRGVF